MYTKAWSHRKPEEVEYHKNSDSTAEVWIRENIHTETTAESLGEAQEQFVYDEVYFYTTESKETILGDPEKYFQEGKSWEPAIAPTAPTQSEINAELFEKNANLEEMVSDLMVAILEGGM